MTSYHEQFPSRKPTVLIWHKSWLKLTPDSTFTSHASSLNFAHPWQAQSSSLHNWLLQNWCIHAYCSRIGNSSSRWRWRVQLRVETQRWQLGIHFDRPTGRYYVNDGRIDELPFTANMVNSTLFVAAAIMNADTLPINVPALPTEWTGHGRSIQAVAAAARRRLAHQRRNLNWYSLRSLLTM
jgi:hypothetical protein